MTQVTMTNRLIRPGVCAIDIAGDVTSAAENVLMDAYTRATGDEAQVIMLNFEEMEYMNSSGIGLLVTMLIRAQRHGQKLMAYQLSEHYQQIFSLTRLDDAISIYANESDCLLALKEV